MIKLLHKFMPKWICYTCRENTLREIQGRPTVERESLIDPDVKDVIKGIVLVIFAIIVLIPIALLVIRFATITAKVILG